MPEGPEVFALHIALKDLGYTCETHGKHLFLKDPYTGQWLDYSFGLAGKVMIHDKSLALEKIKHTRLASGDVKEILYEERKQNLGVDWMTCTKEEVEIVIRSWLCRKKQVGILLKDQKEIAGIGMFWLDIILSRAKIHHQLKSNLLQFLNLIPQLCKAIIEVRDEIKKLYIQCIPQKRKKFINDWYENLFSFRSTKYNSKIS